MDTQKASMSLKIIGFMLISCVISLPIGYYLGDRGARWYPNTVDAILFCLFAGTGCLLGSSLISGAVKMTAKGIRIKKRIFLLSMLLMLISLIHLLGCQFQKKTPLTALPAEDFEITVSAHADLLVIYDREMESVLRKMHAQDIFTKPTDTPLSLNEERFLRQSWLSIYNYAFSIDQIRQFYQDWYRFDVSRSYRPRHVQSYLLSYSADVILYEKAMRTIQLVKKNANAVKFLNTPHPDSDIGENSFSRFQLDLFGADCHTRIYSEKLYLEWLEKGLKARNSSYYGPCKSLWDLIDTRLLLVERMGMVERGKTIVNADMELVRKGVNRVWFPAQKGVAEWMGDTRMHRVGQYLITPQLQDQLNKQLEPGDVLLSRKNWYLSNVGLPGFWPHAILYIGQPEKLTAYFDDPDVADYLKTIAGKEITFEQYLSERFPDKWLRYRSGTEKSDYHVIEAIKYGVILNPLSKACGDYLAALRPRLTKVAKAQAVIEAFSHLEKPYDFDFDFATDHALVCTELVWRSYQPDAHKNGLDIKLVEVAGRKTLPANEIAKCFGDEKQNGPQQFEFICFIDASEKEETAFFSDEEAFLKSADRAKWSFLQE